ncbi:MAG TPA: M20/M25/M40 family metallo-hydrolase [Bryobacterales bacterium]|nr:M20/M25/M40 family metallo-hydrolase [Bryobacterales bacterium]
MDAAQILRHIDPDALARDTLAFLKVRSETGDEAAASRFFADLLRREGFEAIFDEAAPGRPNVYARLPGAARSPSLLLNGHLDTIPIGNSDPPGRDGDWIVGRGAEDMKGGLAAMLHAASAIRKAGLRLAGDLWLTAVIGHETPIGKKEGPLRLIEHLRSPADGMPRADAALIVEGPAAIWAASLGSTIFTVTISSPCGILHTIKVPYAENPARWVGRLLAEFERLEASFDAGPRHALCGREQLNVGIVRAGDYPNRLPTPATVTGTWRWLPGKTHAHVRAALEALCARLAAESGLDFRASFEGHREPFETPAAHPLVHALESAGSAVLGKAPERIGMALVCDANLYSNDAAVPTVCYGPAHQTAHSDHERVSLAQLVSCARIYALTAVHFCGMAEP